MKIKSKIQLLFLTVILCIMFCGCGKVTSESKGDDSADVASSTDGIIDGTDIASLDNTENVENNLDTTQAITDSGIMEENQTGSGNVSPSNNGGASTQNNSPSATTQVTTEDSKPDGTTGQTEPTQGTIEWYQYTYGENWVFYYYEVDGHKNDNETTTTTTTEATTETISIENCTHPWDKRKWGGYIDVHYEGVYEEQLVCVQEAYDEKVYEYHNLCNGCDVDLDLLAVELGYGRIYGGASPAMIGHACYWSEAWQEYTYASYHCEKVQVDTIHHDAVYEMQDVCITPEWGIIYAVEICSVCGGEVKHEHSTYYGEESDFAWYNDPYVP